MAIGSYHFIDARVAAWLGREQEAVIDYLKEENKVLREQLVGKPLRLTNAQRRRLARKGKLVGRRGLRELGCIVIPCWAKVICGWPFESTLRTTTVAPTSGPRWRIHSAPR